jgi:hypothetical protein
MKYHVEFPSNPDTVVFEVEADSEGEAIGKAKQMYEADPQFVDIFEDEAEVWPVEDEEEVA